MKPILHLLVLSFLLLSLIAKASEPLLPTGLNLEDLDKNETLTGELLSSVESKHQDGEAEASYLLGLHYRNLARKTNYKAELEKYNQLRDQA